MWEELRLANKKRGDLTKERAALKKQFMDKFKEYEEFQTTRLVSELTSIVKKYKKLGEKALGYRYRIEALNVMGYV